MIEKMRRIPKVPGIKNVILKRRTGEIVRETDLKKWKTIMVSLIYKQIHRLKSEIEKTDLKQIRK